MAVLPVGWSSNFLGQRECRSIGTGLGQSLTGRLGTRLAGADDPLAENPEAGLFAELTTEFDSLESTLCDLAEDIGAVLNCAITSGDVGAPSAER